MRTQLAEEEDPCIAEALTGGLRVAQENPEKSLSICCARGEPSNFLWWMATASEGAHGASEEHLRLFLALSADSRSA